MNPQLTGIEELTGTYPFDIRQSIKALRLNRFFWQMRDSASAERSLIAHLPEEAVQAQRPDALANVERLGPVSSSMPVCVGFIAAPRPRKASRPPPCSSPDNSCDGVP